jgi:hypothetical protein
MAGLISPGTAHATTPFNDDFANATNIAALPFTSTVDATDASQEAGEPSSSCTTISRSVWYAFTATETVSVTVRTSIGYYPVVAVFTGSSLANLTQVGCRYYYSPLTFRATAGQTYYLQLGNAYNYSGAVGLSLEVAPPVQAAFSYWPNDPSSFESTHFYDSSYDPGGSSIVSQSWQFGDGTTGTGYGPSHQYPVDGDYSVQLAVATSDGRTASVSRVVHVQTHDVTIDRFATPEAAGAGQTRAVNVGIKNNRSEETVQVTLYKSTPYSFVEVGSLTQFVPVRPSNRTTEFSFNYTFTADDAAIGKVTFRAVASIVGAHDALPMDNESISTPTRVS